MRVKKIYIKLFFTFISILVSAVMVVSVSFAWLVLSKSPAVNNISVMIGGGKTILLAPDLTTTVIDASGEEKIVHYPGTFSDTLNFSEYDSYNNLSKVSGLIPVSSADGRYWMIPAYDENGDLLPVEEFTVDDTLSYANRYEDGCYVYLDFWIVSPGSEYDIHVSTDKKTQQGSYLVELPGVTVAENGGMTLAETQNVVASSARIGFLVNNDTAADADVIAYMHSNGFDSRYNALLGVYQEPGETPNPTAASSFLIYEPNGTLHSSAVGENGSYLITRPLLYDNWMQQIRETDISDHLTVQTESIWKQSDAGVSLEAQFQTAVAGKTELTAAKAQDYFYRKFLQGQLSPYISTGLFVRQTPSLYAAAADGVVSPDKISTLETAGASDSGVVTRLERNTPQRIRMFVWLEGQDPDCRNASKVRASQIALRMELAGSTT